MKLPTTYKDSKGKRLRIDQMNHYHLEGAIKKIIRKFIVNLYDKRKKLGYKRGLSSNAILSVVSKTLFYQPLYQALVLESTKRVIHALFGCPYTTYALSINLLCRREWKLQRQLAKVSEILRK